MSDKASATLISQPSLQQTHTKLLLKSLPSQESLTKAYLESKRGGLYKLTLACAIFHSINFFIALIIFWASNDMYTFSVPVCYPKFSEKTLGSKQFMTFNITLATAIFSLLSAVFHIFCIWNWVDFNAMISKRYNIVRWAEYSASAALMAIIIDLVNGVTNVLPLLYHFAAVSLLMWAGLLVEYSGLGSTMATYVSVAANVCYGTVIAANILTVTAYSDEADNPAVLYTISLTIGTLFASFGYYQAYWQFTEFFKRPRSDGSVYMKVYDLSFGLAKGLSPATLGTRVDMIPHTSILVHGSEIFYMNGIQCAVESDAEKAVGMSPSDIVKLGKTSRSSEDVVKWLNSSAMDRYANYHIISNNCMDFSNDLSTFLGTSKVPQDLKTIPDEVSKANPDLLKMWSDHDMKHSFKYYPPTSGRLPSKYSSSSMPFSRYINYEKGYLVLSLVSKALLTYLILWAGLSGHPWTSNYKCDMPSSKAVVLFNGTGNTNGCYFNSSTYHQIHNDAVLISRTDSQRACANLIAALGYQQGEYAFITSQIGDCYYCTECSGHQALIVYDILIQPCGNTTPPYPL